MGEDRRSLQKIISILILLFLAGVLWGQEVIKVPGKLVLDRVGFYKHFNGILTVTTKGIEIKTEKNIFQLFNDFDTPRVNRLFVSIQALRKIELIKNQLHLYTYYSFYEQYRNYFLDIQRGVVLTQNDEALVFLINKTAAFDTQVFKRLIGSVELEIRLPFKRAAVH